jgi:hypothetical protein
LQRRQLRAPHASRLVWVSFAATVLSCVLHFRQVVVADVVGSNGTPPFVPAQGATLSSTTWDGSRPVLHLPKAICAISDFRFLVFIGQNGLRYRNVIALSQSKSMIGQRTLSACRAWGRPRRLEVGPQSSTSSAGQWEPTITVLFCPSAAVQVSLSPAWKRGLGVLGSARYIYVLGGAPVTSFWEGDCARDATSRRPRSPENLVSRRSLVRVIKAAARTRACCVGRAVGIR